MANRSHSPYEPPELSADTGVLPGNVPYAAIGDGPRPLVVLPGVGDALWWGRYSTGIGPILSAYFAPYLGDRPVYLLSRPRGLPTEYSIEACADDHAPALAEIGPVDVLGISFGGLVGQQLCVRHPDLVERLMIVDSASRLAPTGHRAVERLHRHATDHDWFSLRAELARGLYADWRQFLNPPLIQTVGRWILPRPAAPADVRISLAAILAYDGRTDLVDITQPTLVIGGADDPYFSAACKRETADGIPSATLSLIRGAKHGALHERKGTVDRQVVAFLDEERAELDVIDAG